MKEGTPSDRIRVLTEADRPKLNVDVPVPEKVEIITIVRGMDTPIFPTPFSIPNRTATTPCIVDPLPRTAIR